MIKKAPLYFGDSKKKITCHSEGQKDPWGKIIWYDDDGKAYELKYARWARAYAFVTYSHYNKEA